MGFGNRTATLSDKRSASLRFWDSCTTPALQNLLVNTGYTPERTAEYIQWYREAVLPALGPEPHNGVPFFDSFCNDDFSPVELSWNHQRETATVRVGLEPIGPDAGRSQDPFNQTAAVELLCRLAESCSSIQLDWFNHFRNCIFVEAESAEGVVTQMASNEHMTTNTVSFDLNPESGMVVPKVYFYPVIKSLQSGEAGGELVCDAIARVDTFDLNPQKPLDVLREFIVDCKQMRQAVRLECVNFDYVAPERSRIKLYVRTTNTSFRTVATFFTLGGRLSGSDIVSTTEKLRRLWLLLTGVTDLDRELLPSKHRTAGIIFNFELRPGEPLPSPKVYIPVRHYCKNDLLVARALETFFCEQGWDELARDYAQKVSAVL